MPKNSKKKPQNKELLIPILGNRWQVVVLVTQDPNWLRKRLYHYGMEVESLNFAFSEHIATTFDSDGCYPVIHLRTIPKSNRDMATLAHEATHAVKAIFQYIGETSIGEVFAYSVDNIVFETLEALKPKKIRKSS